MAATAETKRVQMVHFWSICGMPTSGGRRSAGRQIRDRRRNSGTEDTILRADIASQRESTTYGRSALSSVHRRVTPWRELTRHCSLRPGGASLLAQTLRSEQGGDRSRAQWSRLAPPPPLFHLTHGLRHRALGCSRQGEGCTIELDSSSLAPGVGPLHRVTTPAGREE